MMKNKIKKIVFMCLVVCMSFFAFSVCAEEARESPELGETVAPEIDIEDTGDRDEGESPKTGDNSERYILPLGIAGLFLVTAIVTKKMTKRVE